MISFRQKVRLGLIKRLVRHDIIDVRLTKRLQQFGIESLLDVGANKGQFASMIREAGYRGKIISFEPVSETFSVLQQLASDDANHEAHNFALGDQPGQTTINVADNGAASSSVLQFGKLVTDGLGIQTLRSESIEIKTLDGFIADQDQIDVRATALKLDVQGFEKKVLEGASETLSQCPVVYFEASFRPLYDGEATFTELFTFMAERGFQCLDVSSSVFTKEGQPLQCDALFVSQALFDSLPSDK